MGSTRTACVFLNACPGISTATTVYQLFAGVATRDIMNILKTGSAWAIGTAIVKPVAKVAVKIGAKAKEFTGVGFVYDLISGMVGRLLFSLVHKIT